MLFTRSDNSARWALLSPHQTDKLKLREIEMRTEFTVLSTQAWEPLLLSPSPQLWTPVLASFPFPLGNRGEVPQADWRQMRQICLQGWKGSRQMIRPGIRVRVGCPWGEAYCSTQCHSELALPGSLTQPSLVLPNKHQVLTLDWAPCEMCVQRIL